MAFVATLLVSAIAAIALAPALRRAPAAFYAAAIVVDALFAAQVAGVIAFPRGVWLAFFTLVQKCALPLALFTIVMFIGCFSADSRIRQRLQPVRGELSVTACILTLGHMAIYLGTYLPAVADGMRANMALAFAVAIALLALLAILGATSFKAVRRRMDPERWKRLQKLAYLFFGLAYLHILLALAPSAIQGGLSARVSILAYSAVFAAYLCARIARARSDRKPQRG